jgi:hypothetical protein
MNENEIVKAPEELTQHLSRRALQIAQVIGPRKTGRGLNSLIPYSQPGIVGLEVPDRFSYMLDINNGMKAHAMVNIAGRVIPIRNSDGTMAFRKATANKIGQVPIITRAASNGKIISALPQWTYPDKTGTQFLERAIYKSVEEWTNGARAEDVVQMLLKTTEKNDVSEVFYGRPTV